MYLFPCQTALSFSAVYVIGDDWYAHTHSKYLPSFILAFRNNKLESILILTREQRCRGKGGRRDGEGRKVESWSMCFASVKSSYGNRVKGCIDGNQQNQLSITIATKEAD